MSVNFQSFLDPLKLAASGSVAATGRGSWAEQEQNYLTAAFRNLNYKKTEVRIGEQDVFLAFAGGHDFAVITDSPWGCCGLVGIGKGSFLRRTELQASGLEQYPSLSVKDRFAGQKECQDHHVSAGRCRNGGSCNR